jgi:hypothetical protein
MLVTLCFSHHVGKVIQRAKHIAKVRQEHSVENLGCIQIILKEQ